MGFFKLIETSRSDHEGPYGSTSYSTQDHPAIRYAMAGDVIAWNEFGIATSVDTLTHAMFVTEVNGSYGSRTSTNIKVAAHTAYSDSAKQCLLEYSKGYNDNRYAVARIWCGWYAIPQP